MSSDRAAFIAAIAADPAADLPRLVFADWLDDHGDPDRAAFVRLQCGAAAGEPRRPLSKAASDRIFKSVRGWTRTLADVLGFEADVRLLVDRARSRDPAQEVQVVVQSRPFPQYPKVHFRRGFAETLELATQTLPATLDWAAAFAREPITRLALTLGRDGRWAEHSVAALQQVRALELFDTVPDSDLVGVLADEHLTGVEEIDFQRIARVDGDFFSAFFGGPLPAGVQSLAFPPVEGAVVARRLADYPELSALERLRFMGNGPEVLAALAVVPVRRQLVGLELWSDITDADVAAFARSDGWDRLAELRLRYANIGDAGVAALARAPFVGQLRKVGLGGNRGITDAAGFLAFCEKLDLDNLVELELSATPATAAVREVLAPRLGSRWVEIPEWVDGY